MTAKGSYRVWWQSNAPEADGQEKRCTNLSQAQDFMDILTAADGFGNPDDISLEMGVEVFQNGQWEEVEPSIAN